MKRLDTAHTPIALSTFIAVQFLSVRGAKNNKQKNTHTPETANPIQHLAVTL